MNKNQITSNQAPVKCLSCSDYQSSSRHPGYCNKSDLTVSVKWKACHFHSVFCSLDEYTKVLK